VNDEISFFFHPLGRAGFEPVAAILPNSYGRPPNGIEFDEARSNVPPKLSAIRIMKLARFLMIAVPDQVP